MSDSTATRKDTVRGDHPTVDPLKPGLMSIADACRYLSISRAKFYADILPRLDSVPIGSRNLIVSISLDRYIREHTRNGHVET